MRSPLCILLVIALVCVSASASRFHPKPDTRRPAGFGVGSPRRPNKGPNRGGPRPGPPARGKPRPGQTAKKQPPIVPKVDPQRSLQLDPRVIMSNLANNGQDTPQKGQVPSLTSCNNFINFCAGQNVPLTNGKQIKSGSCNPTIMGRILAVDKMPSAKFVNPPNGGKVRANRPFTIQLAVKNLETGKFVNPKTNYFSAPAQTTEDGTLIGHSHVVIERLTSKLQTKPTDPRKFVFFKGLNEAAEDGILTAEVSGLLRGEYRIASINAAANHQSALSAVAQRGSNDDISYFTAV